jgi:hypothetical protein
MITDPTHLATRHLRSDSGGARIRPACLGRSMPPLLTLFSKRADRKPPQQSRGPKDAKVGVGETSRQSIWLAIYIERIDGCHGALSHVAPLIPRGRI